MKFIIISGSIILPLVMIYIYNHWQKIYTLLNILMILSVIIFGNIAALSIYQIIKNGEVFMTAIHAVFLNPIFLITGAYIGIYTIHQLMLLLLKDF